MKETTRASRASGVDDPSARIPDRGSPDRGYEGWGPGDRRDLISKDPPRRLDDRSLRDGVAYLARMDSSLATVVRRHGPPPLWARSPGVATLIQIILEQQVSLASGRAMYARVEAHLGEVTAGSLIQCGETGLKPLGLTRQKAAYCVAVAEQIQSGELSLRRVAAAPDPAAREELQRVKGIGPWTAEVYLLMALGRPDIWPTGDVALLTALGHLRGRPIRPSVEEADEYAWRWSPWRAVAARILWHGYLAGSLRRPEGRSTQTRS